MKVCIGGTFNQLHDGHKALFEKAFKIAKVVLIGITSDQMAVSSRTTPKINDYSKRKRNLLNYLNKSFQGAKFKIEEIEEIYDQPITQYLEADAIVTSEGKKDIVKKINRLRRKNNLKPLESFFVPYVLAEDGTPIKSTKIINREMDRHGRMLRPIIVNVGSMNKVKLEATNTIFSKIFPKVGVKVKGLKVATGVKDQPFGTSTIKGAVNRAKAAMGSLKSKGKSSVVTDFGVGIEAGLFWNSSVKNYFDVQYCAIIDKTGKITIGHGSGFQYPKKVITEVKTGKSIGMAMEELTGIKNIGHKRGAIGYLSRNIMDRTKLTEQAVLMAMIPRLRNIR